MSVEAPYFGIDFGTTNSSMAWYDPKKDEARILLNFEGYEKTPSVVYFDEDGEVLVGKDAEDKIRQYENSPDPREREEASGRIQKSIKRKLINPPFIPIPGRDEPVRPVEVVAEILKKLKHDAEKEHFYEEIERVVITHPAVFGKKKQEVLLEAAAMAGFRRIEPYEEPTAAALTVTRLGQKVGDGVMVYDLGAGTFDLSVLVRDGDEAFYLPMEPRGDPECGGDDFDLLLYRHCDDIARETLGRPISLTDDLDLIFLRDCRDRKHNLSRAKQSMFTSTIGSENGWQRFKHQVKQEKFWALIRSRVDSTVEQTAELWEDAGEQVHELDTLVLIGGASRVPLIEQLLEEKLGIEPRNFAGKDYAVALGAAYHAYEIWKPPNGRPDDPRVAEYRRLLKICWTDRKLTPTEVELLKNSKEELDLDPAMATNVEREVMGDTIESVLERQVKWATEQYRKVLQLGWKDKKLEALKPIPHARLDMLLDNYEFFCDYDFPDCPISAVERKELVGQVPWGVFSMAARVAVDESLNAKAASERLWSLADELGMSKEQTIRVERNVLGGTAEEFLKQAVLDEYRKALKKAGAGGKSITKPKEDKLSGLKARLRLDDSEAGGIEREVLGDTLAAILTGQKEVNSLARKHSIDLSRISGSGKNSRITKRDIEWQIEASKPKLDLSKLRSDLDKHGEKFVAECENGAKRIMESDSDWQNNLGKCLDPALSAYAKGVQKEAQAEVDKLKLGLTVLTFPTPQLSREIEADKELSDNTAAKVGVGVAGGIGGAAAGAAAGALAGSVLPIVGNVTGAVIGGIWGAVSGANMATEGVGDTRETPDREKSLTNVRTAARGLRPALKEEAEEYLDKVEKAVAAKQKGVRA